MSSKTTTVFELATWYDTWNEIGLNNLISGNVPLQYASRYNLAFASLVSDPAGCFTIGEFGQYADSVKNQILAQAPSPVVYVGLGSTGIVDTVADNEQYQNRSTTNIVAWLKANGYSGISIDAEDLDVMQQVPTFVTQLGNAFKATGLGIAVSVPWPGNGPTYLYGANAVQAFNDNVDALELQDYSSDGSPTDIPIWTQAGVNASILMGGVCTENGDAQTSLEDTHSWTQYCLSNGVKGFFSWRLDNDHGSDGTNEDVDPTFTGAKAIYDAATVVTANRV
ncbi:MAG: hypothetical protein ABI623_12715 [bacterium]